MRITNNMLVRTMMMNLNNNLERMDKVQQQMSTGKKIRVPSDDPIIASRALKFRTDVWEIEQFKKNTDDAYSWADMTEQALVQLGDIIHRARELTVQASNSGTLTDDDRLKIEAEITQLKRSLVDIGNTSYAGRYIFAGYKTDKPPFEIESHPVLGEMIKFKGKYLNLGGAVSDKIPSDAYQTFYNNNSDKIAGQPELMMGNFSSFTATAPDLNIDITLDGVRKTISLTDGVTYDLNTIIPELQDGIDIEFGAGNIKVGREDNRLKFTVLQGNAIRINTSASDCIYLPYLGFANGVQSVRDEKQDMVYEIGVGSKANVNLEGQEVFGNGVSGLFVTFQKLELALNSENTYRIADETGEYTSAFKTDDVIADLDRDMNRILKLRADLGGRMNYIELTQNRLQDDYINFTDLMSKNEDADLAEVIIFLKNEENVYRASLATGARIIQPTLIDFIR